MCTLVFLLLVTAAAALPAKDELMFDLGDDTAVVESTVREARAAVPEHIEELLEPGVKQAYLHTYGDKEDADGNVQGYHKRTQDKGNDGYKHFDSYHKKDGDKFGFETHSAYGKAEGANAGASGKSGKYSDEEGAEEKDDDKAETKQAYKVVEDVNEGKKGVRALEDDDGDSGYYADSGDSENYSEGGGDSSSYSEGDGESENYESASEDGDGESGHYTEGDEGGSTAAEYDDGESEAYTAEEESDDY